ncbi:MAG: glycosyltransferase family 39 protein [Polyangiaceae bacterium]|nr:glycosyltransferase family 39 protein [Polyangiaceae bacterium]
MDDDAREQRLTDRIALGAAIAAIAFVLANLVAYRYGRDQGIYAVVAGAMQRGGAPYKDAWDFKPPGIFFIYWLARALFGASEHGVRVLEAGALASMCGAFAVLSRRWVGAWQAGVLGAACAVGVHGQLEFWHTGQPESFGGVMIAWALVCATYRPASDDPRARAKLLAAWIGCGALYTAAALCKPPLGGGFLVSAAFLAREELRLRADEPLSARVKAALRPVAALAVGGALVLSLCLAYFAAKGALRDLYQTLFVFTPHYTKLSFERRWLNAYLYFTLQHFLVEYSSFICVGVLTFLVLPPLGSREREGLLHLTLVAALQLFGVALQAKFFPYHYGATLPLGCLVAGWGAWKLWRRLSRTSLGVVVFGVALYWTSQGRGATRDLEDTYWDRCRQRVAAWLDPSKRRATEDHLYSVADVSSGANRDVAAWLVAHTSPDDRVYIWGFEPEIYDLSARRPASRYIYNVPQRATWSTETRADLMAELEHAPPAVIVVERRDVFPVVTGNSLDSNDSMRDFPRFARFLRDGYEQETRIEDFDLYVRR